MRSCMHHFLFYSSFALQECGVCQPAEAYLFPSLQDLDLCKSEGITAGGVEALLQANSGSSLSADLSMLARYCYFTFSVITIIEPVRSEINPILLYPLLRQHICQPTEGDVSRQKCTFMWLLPLLPTPQNAWLPAIYTCLFRPSFQGNANDCFKNQLAYVVTAYKISWKTGNAKQINVLVHTAPTSFNSHHLLLLVTLLTPLIFVSLLVEGIHGDLPLCLFFS
eukprot:1145486-Pelagomonas_calceolata.AAC.5